MKLQQTPILNQNVNSQKKSTQKGSSSSVAFGMGEGLTQALTYLQTNQGLGASFVDAAFMCTPRTIVDFTRGPQAGTETAIREFSSNINDAALGAYGLGAAWLLSQGFNKKYGKGIVEAHKMPVDKDMLDALADIRYRNGNLSGKENADNLKAYLDEVFNSTTGFNPNVTKENNGWGGIGDNKAKIVQRISEQLNDTSTGKEAETKLKETKAYVKALLVDATKSESDIKIERHTGVIDPKTNKEIVIKSASSVDDFINDVYRVTKSFMSKEVSDLFGDKKMSKPEDILTAINKNNFLNEFKKLKMGTAFLGLAACCAIGASVQPINMYLTKKKTGQTGFVGGGKENNSTGFKIKKAVLAGLGGLALISTIGGKLTDIPNKIQFKGLWPTIPQFKLVYAITIISRLLSARNDNELRESSIKDSLGFANWLILGGFASKLTAMGLEKLVKFKEGSGVDNKFIKYSAEQNVIEKGPFAKKHKPRWLAGTVVSREEVLHQALEKAGVSTVKKVGDKEVALSFKEMLKAAAEKVPEARTKIRYLAIVQLAGYLWSALALGIAVPKINIAITKAVENGRKQKEAEMKAKNQAESEDKKAA